MSGTLSADEIARTFDLSADTLAELAQTIVKDPNSTIEPAQRGADAPGRHAVRELGGAGEARGVVANLVFGHTIGQGGMGLVRAATQRSLGRNVAVKTLRPEMKTEQATLRLLREGWVTGSLEHPNIVPVYDLGLDADGSPLIVLKHIEGAPWSDLVADAAAVKERFGADDLLEHNLRILVQLCNAVSLAHARGIIHRDLKPENVMIGRFGEVYLVDWGIAVSLHADPTGRLPTVAETKEMAGTPAYMAPEMLGVGTLSERTDVYLLGAILHEVLTGRAPHSGASFEQLVASIVLSRFAFAPDVAPELAAIATRAMSRDAADRYASADELRQRIEWYLRHRGSLMLSTEAARRVVEIRDVLRDGTDPDEVRDRVHHLFAEARFGFRQAVRACDDNEVARAGLREVTELVVVYELEEGTPEAAAAALAELETPPAHLAQRVAEAMRAREGEKRRVADLERHRADHDPLIGRRTRMASASMLGVVWTILPSVLGMVLASRQITRPYWTMYVSTFALGLLGVPVVIWARESLLKTIVNRRIVAAVALTFAAQLVLELGCQLLGLGGPAFWAFHLFGWFAMMAAFATLADRRFWPAALVYLGSFLYAATQPSASFHLMSLANFGLLVNSILAWLRPREDREFLASQMKKRVSEARRRRGR